MQFIDSNNRFMAYSNLSVKLSAEQKNDIIGKLVDLKSVLPFLISLTVKERISLRKLGGKRKGFLIDIHTLAKAHPDAIPKVVDIEEFGIDAQLFADLSDIMGYLLPIYEGMQDTILAVGSEALKAADICYGNLKLAEKSNNTQLRQALAEIKKRHNSRSRPKKDGDDTESNG